MLENKCFITLPKEIAKDYKMSRYNIYVNSETRLVYNTVSSAIVAFDNDFVKEENVFDLIELGVLVERETDELLNLEEEYKEREKYVDNFHLIVALTLDCQCRCFYCYEKHSHIYMDKSIQNALIELVERKAKAGQNISIIWYGGEPLMDFPTLKELTRQFQAICKVYNVGYYAGMITNGYYFDDNIISLVDELGIRDIQITLDGMKEVHEKRRPTICNGSSFECIFNNIVRLNDETHTNIRLRINVDKRNIESAFELVKYCAENGLQRMDLTLGMLKEFGCDHNCSTCSKTLYSTEEFADEFLKFREYIAELGFDKAYEKMQPEYKVNTCTMDSPGAYVIDPKGEVYKCISQVGQKESSIGNISTYYDEMAHDRVNPFTVIECKECVYFPICKGGCLNNNLVANNQRCEIWKYITGKLIEMDTKDCISEELND